jgi:hypothetical protein
VRRRPEQGLGGGEPGTAVTDLGQQARGAHAPGAGQAGEDVRVGVRVELLADLLGQNLICSTRALSALARARVICAVVALLRAGDPARCGGEPGVEQLGVRSRRCSRRGATRRSAGPGRANRRGPDSRNGTKPQADPAVQAGKQA